MDSARYVRAVYNFMPGETGDIGLAAGDVVLVTKQIDSNWMTGRNLMTPGIAVGNFPADFVEPFIIPRVGSDECVFVAKSSLKTDVAGDLSFNKGRLLFFFRHA